MSDRDLSASLLTQSSSDWFLFIAFVRLDLDGGTLYLHNGVGSYTWGGQVWEGVGDFGDISVIEEGPEISPYELTLGLSGLDSNLVNEALEQNHSGRGVRIYIGALDSDMALSADPTLMWLGTIDYMRIVAGETNAISVACESAIAIFEKTNGARFTNAWQQTRKNGAYAGDLFLEYIAQMEDATIIWRGEGNDARLTGGSNLGGIAGNDYSIGPDLR